MGAPNWNLNTPGKLGVGALDVGYAQGVIDAAADVETLHFTARAAGNMDTVQLYAAPGAQAAQLPAIFNNLRRPMLVEIVPSGSEAWGALSYTEYSVSAITGTAGMWNENLTTPITTSRLNTTNDNLWIASSVLNSSFDVQFSSGAFPLTNQVLAVELVVRFNLTTRFNRYDSPTGTVWNKEVPMWTPSWGTGVVRWGEAIVEAGSGIWKPWTAQMVRDFASGGTRKVRVVCRAGPGYWKMDRMYLRVFHIPERRLGVGVASPATPSTWVSFPMDLPSGSGAPVSVIGNQYTVMARRIIDYNADNVAGSILPWRHLRGRASDGTWRRHQQDFAPVVQTSSSGKAQLMRPAGVQLDGVPAARILNGATVIADSMPYSLSRGAVCYGIKTVSQFLTVPAGSTVYGQAFVVAGWRPDTGPPAAPLRAEVFIQATGVRVLGAVEVTAADVERLPVTAPSSNVDDAGVVYKTVQLRFDDGVDLTTALHELRFSSPGSTVTRPWFIAAYIGSDHATDQTFGGTTQYAEGEYRDGPSWAPTLLSLTTAGLRSSDILAQLVDVPPAVTGVGAADGSLTAHQVEICSGDVGCEGCAADSMPYVQVTWSPAPTGTPDTVGYQIDRMDDLSPDWERVALVAGRLSDEWNDHEARIGVRSQYRVRVLRSDAVVGDWSDPVSITIPGGQVALAFSSNAATGMGCVYPEVWNGQVVRDWSFREFDDVELRRMYGRNREVAFRPLERRGDGFSRTVLLSFGCTVALPSMSLFKPLRDLAWAPIPYVTVRDGEGNRWLASLTVPEGENRRADAQGTEMWVAEIGVIEAADTPFVHDTSVAQVTGPATP